LDPVDLIYRFLMRGKPPQTPPKKEGKGKEEKKLEQKKKVF